MREVDGGVAWLARLPQLVEECSREWDLLPGEPFAYAFASLALPVTRADGRGAVLKVQWPDRESEHEADALTAWGGSGAVRLIDYDTERRALLIERCEPGTPLSAENPTLALETLISLLPRLWIPAPPTIPSLADEVKRWLQSVPRRWEQAGRPVERRLIDIAMKTMRHLASSQGGQVLVHQDLHADNVLRAQREPWLAIDPKPFIGEREFAVAPIVRGGELGHSRQAVLRRLDRVSSALTLDPERVRGWTIAQTVAWMTFGKDDGSSRHIETVRWRLAD